MGARLAITVSCPECCYDVKPFIVEFTADPDKPRVRVQCPRDECQHTFDVFRDKIDHYRGDDY